MEKQTESNSVGRPSELPKVLEQAKLYLNGEWSVFGDVIPSVAGLACYCGKNRDSMYQYAKESAEFSDIVSSLLTLQENKLLNGGLNGSMNATITKLLLTKHNYSDKQEIDHRTPDGIQMQVAEKTDAELMAIISRSNEPSR